MSSLKTNWPKTYIERSKFMFNNEILSDIKFVVQASQNEDSDDSKKSRIEIPSHKFLLSVCSPVFFEMFCGKMAETKEHIELPDCEYEGMLELLRYIYTDEVCLDGNNVMQVLYLAEKYMIPSLSTECTEYLRKNLTPSNVFCVLKHAKQYESKDLLLDCWDLIDFKTEEALKTAEFQTMERCFLEELLDRDTLSITEMQLFKAVDCWAGKECERQNLEVEGSAKRQVLGEEIVKKIRFPVMEQSEFVDVVLSSKILTEEEANNITKYFDSTLTEPVGFIETERVGSPLRCCRFESFDYDRDWVNDPENREYVELTVDKDIRLYGVSLFGDDGGEYSVTLKIRNARKRSFLATTTGTFTSESKDCEYGTYYGFDVLFDSPVFLKKNVEYYIEALIDGPDSVIFKHEACNVAPCAGVVFYVDGTYQFAEFLFVIR
ncbi:BTB/POZ domain-containing protein 6-like [Oculina patagonica]